MPEPIVAPTDIITPRARISAPSPSAAGHTYERSAPASSATTRRAGWI
jgi:hypothetical protein